MSKPEILKVKVYRFDPSTDKEPYYQDYEVPFQFDKMKILDVIRYIQDEIDSTLSFTWDCRLWNCGLCGLTVNKRPGSACLVDVKDALKNGELLIEPLPQYKVVKDLVIDREVEMQQMKKVGIKYDRHNGEYSLDKIPEEMDPEKVAFFRDWYLACIDCLVCSASCPAFKDNYDFLGPHLCVRIAKYINHPTDQGDRAKQSSEAEVFKCVNCRRCDIVCPLELNISQKTMELLKEETIEEGFTPPSLRDFLENIFRVGNPWGFPKANRSKWAEGSQVEQFDATKHDYLLFIGSTGSYDTRAQQVARSLSDLLNKAGVAFGILGEKEISDGNEVARIGEKGLFEELALNNVETFNENKVTKIITLSPHAFNTFKNEYPEFDGNYEVMHYSHLLKELISSGKLKLNSNLEGKITYHDSCFLGRYNNEYDLPRELLKTIPNLNLIEMERSKENSFCCGGGGGNFVTDLVGGKESPSNQRIREAYETGASILAVSCPICVTMFEDAIKNENLESSIVVKDLSELLLEASS